MGRSPLDVIHVGAASRDLAGDDPRGWRLGGGVSYAALATARLGLATAAIIGLDAEAATADELALMRDRGVELHVVPLRQGPVFRNVETPSGRIQSCVAVPAALPIDGPPPGAGSATAWSFVPVAGELDDGWAALPRSGAVVAVGWQGMLRVLEAGALVRPRPPRDSALLRRADLVGVSDVDLAPGTAITALAAFLRPGARLVVTRGDRGGIALTVGGGSEGTTGSRPYEAVAADPDVDPTGAGDTFLAALLAVTIRPGLSGAGPRTFDHDLRFAAAAASLAVGGLGLSGVPDIEAVRARAERAAGEA